MNTSKLSKSRVHYFKPVRDIIEINNSSIKLDSVVVAKNKKEGKGTFLIIDSNIIIKMEDVVRYGKNKSGALKEYGLHNLIELLKKCPPQSISLNPGIAFREMPPGLVEESTKLYESFCSKHLPEFCDTPDCTHQQYFGKRKNYGILDLSDDGKKVYGESFCSFLYLLSINHQEKLNSIQKFETYINLVSKHVGVLSFKELHVAKYCFSPKRDNDLSFNLLREKIIDNFLKRRGKYIFNAEVASQAAFNFSCDIHLINSAIFLHNTEFDGFKQEYWVATMDHRLNSFAQTLAYMDLGTQTGKLVQIDLDGGDLYWKEATLLQITTLSKRAIFGDVKSDFHLSADEKIDAAMNYANSIFK